MRQTLMVMLTAVGLLTGMAAPHSADALPAVKASASSPGSLVSDARYRTNGIIGDRFYRGFYGRPFIGYRAYYGAGYSEGCGWIRKRAQATGGRYWWGRYHNCIDKNY